MRLSKFIDVAAERIVAESMEYAASLPVLSGEPLETLKDHLPLVLEVVARDLERPQSRAESIAKSQGRQAAPEAETAAQTHGLLRARGGLTVEQLVAEYRVLRSTVLRLWADDGPPGRHVLADTMRFNEALDQAVAESVAFHAAELERWRGIFLGVLGHDLRGPLNAMLLTAQVMDHSGAQGAAAEHARSLLRNGRRLEALLDSLLEYNKSRLGLGMALHRSTVDVALLCRQEVRLLREALPEVNIELDAQGDTTGRFDGSRIREAVSNLVFNGAQHSTAGTPVAIRVRGNEHAVEVTTENDSEPIAPDVLQSLFEPLRRHSTASGANASRHNLGLGLFIVREIARAHGGDVSVSMQAPRISFTIVLPKAGPEA